LNSLAVLKNCDGLSKGFLKALRASSEFFKSGKENIAFGNSNGIQN